MKRMLLAATVATALLACSQPKSAACTGDADCPANATCISGACKSGIPSGGSAATVSGSAHLTAGTKTMDATIGQPVAPAGAAGSRTMAPAEVSR